MISDIYAHYVRETTTSFEYDPPNAEEMARRMTAAPQLPWLVCTGADGAVCGYAYAAPMGERPGYNWSAAVSIYVARQGRGAGVGRRLYTALERLLAAQGYRLMVAIISIPNPDSEAFHRRMGFAPAGRLEHVGYKFGKPLSTGYYCKALAPPAENPPPTIPLSRLAPETVEACLQF